jgi:hypothetical protein
MTPQSARNEVLELLLLLHKGYAAAAAKHLPSTSPSPHPTSPSPPSPPPHPTTTTPSRPSTQHTYLAVGRLVELQPLLLQLLLVLQGQRLHLQRLGLLHVLVAGSVLVVERLQLLVQRGLLRSRRVELHRELLHSLHARPRRRRQAAVK